MAEMDMGVCISDVGAFITMDAGVSLILEAMDGGNVIPADS